MQPARNFQDLVVWQKAHKLVLEIYRLSETFPKSELYCLVPQMRRAAVSIPSNIAEGFRKHSQADKIRFLNIAQGSLEEIRYQLILAHDLGYSKHVDLTASVEDVSKLLDAYKRAIMADSGISF
jgi:four helix bundle protein